jgi:hypothetical protein
VVKGKGMKEFVILSFWVAILFPTGIVCLFWPEFIRKCAIRWNGPVLERYFPVLLNWIKTKSYILSLRIIGGASILLVVILFVFICVRKVP